MGLRHNHQGRQAKRIPRNAPDIGQKTVLIRAVNGKLNAQRKSEHEKQQRQSAATCSS